MTPPKSSGGRLRETCARPAAELLSGEPGTTSTLYTVFSKIALIQVNLKWEFREKISRQNWAFFTNFTYCPAAPPSRTRSPGGGFFVRGLGFPHRGTEARRFFTARPMENQCKRAHGGKEQERPLPRRCFAPRSKMSRRKHPPGAARHPPSTKGGLKDAPASRGVRKNHPARRPSKHTKCVSPTG